MKRGGQKKQIYIPSKIQDENNQLTAAVQKQTQEQHRMSAFDKIMETNRKEQEENPSEKKRERVSPHKGAARPELKKGRTSPQEEASTEEAHMH